MDIPSLNNLHTSSSLTPPPLLHQFFFKKTNYGAQITQWPHFAPKTSKQKEKMYPLPNVVLLGLSIKGTIHENIHITVNYAEPEDTYYI